MRPPIHVQYESTAGEFFNETRSDENGFEQLLPVVPKNILKSFIKSVLTEFSTFSTTNGFYRQTNGLSIGGKLSAQLSNIFCHMLEMEVIKKHENLGNILLYSRYVDDCCVLIKKGMQKTILEEMNAFDPILNFTCKKMISNSLNFSVTTIYIDKNNNFNFLENLQRLM